jgi:hypothetical protein
LRAPPGFRPAQNQPPANQSAANQNAANQSAANLSLKNLFLKNPSQCLRVKWKNLFRKRALLKNQPLFHQNIGMIDVLTVVAGNAADVEVVRRVVLRSPAQCPRKMRRPKKFLLLRRGPLNLRNLVNLQ